MLRFGAAVVAALTLVACTGSTARHPPGPQPSTTRTAPSSAPQSSAPQPGRPGCTPASPIVRGEVHGTSSTASLYGLIMATRPLPIRAKEDVKIVWRMTGHGPLRLSVIDPHGTSVPLQWGPEAHGGSNFDRPGSEWGAGYRFAGTGCWQLRAVRGDASADVWVRVRP